MSTMAIKILPDGPVSKYIVPIRKSTGLGITDIKNKIENKDLLAETDADDIDEMENLKDLVDDLIKLGANVKIFDSDEFGQGTFNYQEISYEEFKNNIGRLKEILEELQDYDDAVSDED
ncbi:hypothetical protein SAMN04488137_3447 [Fictibacillus solisalsi]|uniref:Uncharacterized protein n=1 Tax=Fictibacillus solisalsi TaxID=459525 RepID=A0A1G9YJQ3_9BACL|nr:hypothetical protein [Fictibacillus solisalsi]SDN08713.1 hypothetical protein SAMN04488137_3447 [Fictibacillus solisalsi]